MKLAGPADTVSTRVPQPQGARIAGYAVALLLLLSLPFWAGAYAVSVVRAVGFHAVIAMGLVLLTGLAGQVSLGQAMFYGLGAYGSALLTMRAGLSPWAAIIVAAVITGLVAAFVGAAVLRLKGIIVAGVTLTVNLIFYYLAMSLSDLTGGATGLNQIPRLPHPGGISYSAFVYIVVWLLVVLVLVFSLNISRTRTGRALRAVNVLAGGSEETAQVLGIDTRRCKVGAFVIAAVFASVAGSVYAHFTSVIEPGTFGVQLSVLVAIMAVIGGVTSPWGALIGSALMIGITEFLREVAPIVLGGPTGAYELVAYGVILVATLLFLPEGLFSLPSRMSLRRKRGSL